MKKISGITLAVVVLTLGWIGWVGFWPGEVAAGAAGVAPVGVVLGTKVYPDGQLSQRLQERVDTAIGLLHAGAIREILVSGATGEEGVDEAGAMAGYIRGLIGPSAPVRVDSEGWTTRHTAQNSRAMLGEGAEVVIVSSWYHLARCDLAFRQEGLTVRGLASAPRLREPREIYSWVREGVGIWAYLFRFRG